MEINGMKVADAAKKVTIQISARDCREGKNKDPGACAAAKACLREIPSCTAARVHLSRTYLKLGKQWVRFHTPAAIRSEIIAFDRGASFSPGEYILRPLQPSHRGNQRRQGSSSTKKTGKRRAKPHHVSGVRQYGANR
jgi:hypothetical protein